jgi:DNA anti-recombination protein RmuC
MDKFSKTFVLALYFITSTADAFTQSEGLASLLPGLIQTQTNLAQQVGANTAQSQALETKMVELKAETNANFANVDAQFQKIDAQIEKLHNDTSTQISELSQEMDGRFSELRQEMDGRFSELRQEMDGRFDDMDSRFSELRQEIDGRFDDMGGRFDDITALLNRTLTHHEDGTSQ